jgi:hypothetical protein
MDPRLRSAVDASIGWYEDLCALHGVGSILANGLWSSRRPPPPLHSDAVVVEPSVTADAVLTRLADREHGGFKDSFSTIDMADEGMDLLFAASWIYRAPDARPGESSGWALVTTAAELAEWTAGHDTSAVLLPGLLQRGHFKILAKTDDQGHVAGAVARLGSGVVDVSNVHARPGHSIDWAELASAIHGYFPGRALVGYERGDGLAAAIDGGFESVGNLRVWVR